MNDTKDSKMKTIEERIEDNIKYQTTAEHLKDKPIDQIKDEAEIIGIVGYISEYIQWDPKRGINIAEGLLEDVNLHSYQVVNDKEYDIIKKQPEIRNESTEPAKKHFYIKDLDGNIFGEIKDAVNEQKNLWFGFVELYSMPDNAEYGYFTEEQYKEAGLRLEEMQSSKNDKSIQNIEENIDDELENENKAELENELNQFIGTTQYYPSSFGKLKLTDGVQYLREKGNCYWFIDIIESYQPKLRNVGFQIWGINVNEDKTAIVYCKEDTNRKPLITQKLEYADFPLNDFELYCIDDVVLLKSEY
jgi:hypothetical protein